MTWTNNGENYRFEAGEFISFSVSVKTYKNTDYSASVYLGTKCVFSRDVDTVPEGKHCCMLWLKEFISELTAISNEHEK